MPSYEVIVVGLGAVGSAATWHLARLGTKVLGIDRYKPPHEFGSSTGETRLTRVAVGEGWSTPLWRCARTRFGGKSKPQQAKLSSSSADDSLSPGTQTSRWSMVSTSSSITWRPPPNDITSRTKSFVRLTPFVAGSHNLP